MRLNIKLVFIILLSFLLISFIWSNKNSNRAESSDATVENGQEIAVASWNLKNFGQTKLNDPARIDIIVSVLEKYDITAIQEVQDATLALPEELIAKMNESGKNFEVVSSDRVGRNRKEQYLFIYDDDVIDFIPNTTGYGIEPGDEFAREPFYAMFKAGNFDFYLMTIHTDPDEVGTEIPALKAAYLDFQEKTPNEDDIVLLGDFNAKAPGVTVDSYIVMDVIAEIPNIVFTILEETNTSKLNNQL